MVTRIAIIGCGLIGQKRAMQLGGAELKVACDLELGRAEALACRIPGCVATTDLEVALGSDVDAVIIATANHALCDLALRSVLAGKHVLLEKPGATRANDLRNLLAASERANVRVRLGYNHRYHPAIQKARELVDAGEIGEMMFLRGRYGHGGRLGYEREWRADPKLSGGGELIDQGVHLIDLSRWFLGPFTKVEGHASTFFWNMPVDDNAFLNLRTAHGQVAWLHASCTEWKNLFSFEIYGRTGKLHIEGLGGSYGTERLASYKMLPEMGPPDTFIWEFPRPDRSWEIEMREFIDDIQRQRRPDPGIPEAIAVLEVVESIYDQSRA